MKRIVICADGTWNVRDQDNAITGTRRPTNVTKVARAVLPRDAKGIDQVVYYHDGVGTRGKLDQLTGGAFGEGIDANIRNLYRFVSYNWAPGDELFFFGFSRGAFTVRTLAGFMDFVGLAEKDDDYYVPEMYACYENGWGAGTPQWKRLFVDDPQDKPGPNKRKTRVQGQRPCPPIRFVGVWDTVGALGAPGALNTFFGNQHEARHRAGLNPHIQNAVHALAIDEHRSPFKPTLFSKPPGWTGQLVQAWFPGAHSDIGGSYENDSLANAALQWMLSHATAQGLALDANYLKAFHANHAGPIHNEMDFKYELLGGACQRPIGVEPEGDEFVHQSALDRMGDPACDYQPATLLAHQASPMAWRVLPPKPKA